MLILDGHNSHCTYKFCSFAESKKIIILCLVAHTTHCCQPCDVGAFGPLASAWKAEVMRLSRTFSKVTKYNLLELYANARRTAFSPLTIQTSFRTTGIWPFNRNAIKDVAFEPAKNTSTRSAQPIPASLPPMLELVREPSPELEPGPDFEAPESSQPTTPSSPLAELPMPTSTDSNTPMQTTPGPSFPDDTPIPTRPNSPTPASTPSYRLIDFPGSIPPSSSRMALIAHTKKLKCYAERTKSQLEADYAAKQLMDAENERLRRQLFEKKSKPKKQRVGGAGARHMTHTETLNALGAIDFKVQIAKVNTEFEKLENVIQMKETYDQAAMACQQDYYDRILQARKDIVALKRAEKRAAVDEERSRLKAIADAEKAAAKALADAEKARAKAAVEAEKARAKAVAEEEKAIKKAAAEEEKARKKTEAEVERLRKREASEIEKERKKAVAAAEKLRKQAEKGQVKAVPRKRQRANTDPTVPDENSLPMPAPSNAPSPKRPRPTPRRIQRPVVSDLPTLVLEHAAVPVLGMSSLMNQELPFEAFLDPALQ